MNLKFSILVLAFFFFSKIGIGQPSTEIYLLNIQKKGNMFSLEENAKLKNVSNNIGYDNQPSFIEKINSIAYVSSRGEKPTDVYLYEIETASSKQLTNNEDAEYSPKITPDGKFISIVKGAEQNLTSVSLYGSVTEKIYISKDSIGYYCWLNNDEIAAFVLSKPSPSLKLINIKNNSEKYLMDSIGRSLFKYEDGIIVCQKLYNQNWITFVDKTGSYLQWMQLPPNTEDFYLTEDGWIFSSNESVIIYCNIKETNKGWQELVNFKDQGISKIFRIAVNKRKNLLAFVAEERSETK